MPVLAEITLGYNPVWVDDDVATWVDDAIAEWSEGAESSLKIADRRFYDVEYWDELILGFGPVAYAMDTEYGGMITPKAGSITIAMTAFASTIWPPPREGTISIKYTESTYAAAVTLFEGACHLASISYPESVVYNLYGLSYGGDMLEACEDYEGKASVYPRGFGRVEHMPCVRLADVFVGGEGSQDIGACYTAGHLLDDGNFRVFEDGYDITDTIDNLDDYYIDGVYPGIRSFSLKVFPLGEVTVCGNGAYSTISGIFSWGCGLLAKNLDNTYVSSDGFGRIDAIVDGQTDILQFLSSVAAGCNHAYYFDGSDLVLFSMHKAVGTSRTINIPAESLASTKIDCLAPKAKISHTKEIITVISDIETVIERSEKEISVITDYSYGDLITVNVNSIDDETILHRLQAIADVWHQERMSISLPMAGTLPLPGQQIEIYDDRYDRIMTGTFFVRDISYDFSNRQITISGEGKVS